LSKLKDSFKKLTKLSISENPFMESDSVISEAGLNILEEVLAAVKTLEFLNGVDREVIDKRDNKVQSKIVKTVEI
jgi:hypothetical protein